jgi:hypothetical protein
MLASNREASVRGQACGREVVRSVAVAVVAAVGLTLSLKKTGDREKSPISERRSSIAAQEAGKDTDRTQDAAGSTGLAQ